MRRCPTARPLKDLRRASPVPFRLNNEALANWHQARLALACMHSTRGQPTTSLALELARNLCQTYDAVYLEDLELRGMQRLWGARSATLSTATSFASCLMWRNSTGPSMGFVGPRLPVE